MKRDVQLFKKWLDLVDNTEEVQFSGHDRKLAKKDKFKLAIKNWEQEEVFHHTKEFSADVFQIGSILVRFRHKNGHVLKVDWGGLEKQYLIDFGYHGSGFEGVQKQTKHHRTVQAELESVLKHLYQHPVQLNLASRTDKDVHAFHNYAHFSAPSNLSVEEVTSLANKMIADDIFIHQIKEVSSLFHARYDAVGKTYQYRVRTQKSLERMHAAWFVPDLDIDDLKSKLKLFKGTHNFRNFSKFRDYDGITTRTIYSLKLFEENDEVVIEIKGRSFLRYMIRMMMGALVYYDAATIQRGLSFPNEDLGKHIAPGHGLYLMDIEY